MEPADFDISPYMQTVPMTPGQPNPMLIHDEQKHIRDIQQMMQTVHQSVVMPSSRFNPNLMEILTSAREQLAEETHRVSQDYALQKMTPVAREKYEPVFKLLGINVRMIMDRKLEGPPDWKLSAVVKGHHIRVIWSATEHDPGCSLAVWDAMVAALLDEIAYHERSRSHGAQPTSDSASAASTGQLGTCSAGTA